LLRHWTNPSVLALAGDRDPIEAVTERARELVTRALDEDWVGPPFDPIKLASILGFDVRPLADIPDARTVSIGADRFRIDYNPNRPSGRVRYSIAHEIAHTFFPDCGERVRNRLAHANATLDEWQLEALCNIAAAEILMPFGSFPAASERLTDIDRVIALQKQFKVSTEALLLRIVRIAPSMCAAFSASQVEEGSRRGRWRVDYVVGSSSWPEGAVRGTLLPPDTRIQECAGGIGFTTRSDEVWDGRSTHVEAVALPPYPGAITPRVAGFVSLADEASASAALALLEVVGDALQPRGAGPNIVAHVVTDKAQTWGGGGFAAALRQRWPHVHEDFSAWAGQFGRNLQLGRVRFCDAPDSIRVASMVAQHGYGAARTARVRYVALEQCITEVFREAADAGATVHLPRIGTGHGGGSWPIIRDMVESAAAQWRVSAVVYRLPTRESEVSQERLVFAAVGHGGAGSKT
jgi:O-acetyl-ADP-ribose deacetylase (regulator of RNase III)